VNWHGGQHGRARAAEEQGGVVMGRSPGRCLATVSVGPRCRLRRC